MVSGTDFRSHLNQLFYYNWVTNCWKKSFLFKFSESGVLSFTGKLDIVIKAPTLRIITENRVFGAVEQNIGRFEPKKNLNNSENLNNVKTTATSKAVKNCKFFLLYINILKPFTNHGKVKSHSWVFYSVIAEFSSEEECGCSLSLPICLYSCL